MRNSTLAGTVLAAVIAAIGAASPAPGQPCATNGCPTPAPGVFRVRGTDGTLLVQSAPRGLRAVGAPLSENAVVRVLCQVDDGEPVDGRSSRVWDQIGPGRWLYDAYVSTPKDGPNARSTRLPGCDDRQTPPLAHRVAPTYGPLVAHLQAGTMQVAPRHAAMPLAVAGVPGETAAAAWAAGFCQNLVLANTPLAFARTIWPDLNTVALWPADARAAGSRILHQPVPGSVVVFGAGFHRWGPDASDRWYYGVGHVAMVVYAEAGRYVVAEFNYGAVGVDGRPGGWSILSFRAIPWPLRSAERDPATFIWPWR